MRSVSALLFALAASAATDLADADFTVSSATTTLSGTSYVRQWTLTASGSSSRYVDQIKVEAPGQVFIRYLSGQPAGVAGYVNVTGASSAAVEAIVVRTDGDDSVDDVDDDDDVDDSDDNDGDELRVSLGSTTAGTDAVVTEIFLAQERTISQLQSKSSGDVIVEAGVVVASGSDEDLEFDVQGSGSVYVSDPSAAISLKEFQAKVSGSGSLQIEVDSLAFTEDAEFQVQRSGSISLFASSLSCDELKFDADGSSSGSVCISAETISATSSEVDSASKVSLPNSSNKYRTTGSAACTQATVPSRATSSSPTTTSPSTSPSTTTTPGSATSTSSPTPTPTNGGAALSIGAVSQLVVLAIAAVM